MNDLSIALNGSTLSFGQEKIDLVNCTLDNLTDVFGEPDMAIEYPKDDRYRIYIFYYDGNMIKAFVRFKIPQMFFCTTCIEKTSIVEDDTEIDKGILVELHVELEDFFPLNLLKEPLSIVEDPEGQLAIISQQFAVCLFDKDTVSKMIFVNPQIMSIRKSFFSALHVGQTTADTYLIERQIELRQTLEDMRAEKSKKLSYLDIVKMIAGVLCNPKGSTKK